MCRECFEAWKGALGWRRIEHAWRARPEKAPAAQASFEPEPTPIPASPPAAADLFGRTEADARERGRKSLMAGLAALEHDSERTARLSSPAAAPLAPLDPLPRCDIDSAPGHQSGPAAGDEDLHDWSRLQSRERRAQASHKRLVWASFGAGLAVSGACGCIALIVLLFLDSELGTRPSAFAIAEASVSTPSATGTAESAGLPRSGGLWARPTSAGEPRPSSFEVLIGKDKRHKAVLSLPGIERGTVVVRDVPEPVWLSKGERQDEHTWVLQPADLDDLYLSVGEGTPEAFDMTIETTSPDERRLRTIARVRLVDAPSPVTSLVFKPRLALRTELTPGAHTLDGTPVFASVKSGASAAGQNPADPLRTQRARGERAGEAIYKPPAVTDPERGALAAADRYSRPSALGATLEESDSRLPAEGRRLWWKLPAPPSSAPSGNPRTTF
jgi:hypothetical protein